MGRSLDPDDLSGEQFRGRIPDHQILRCIGAGAFGRVWLAVNSLGNYRAVKTIERSEFPANSQAFEIEWEGIKKYEEISSSHPRLVTIFHAGRAEDDSYFYYVMELGDDILHGRRIVPESYRVHTLQDHIFDLGNRLPLKECIQVGVQLSGALDQFHINGLLHRDVKPSNIIYVNGVPKLTDMGLVTAIDESDDYLGTEGFLPREGSNSIKSDIYSLGKTLYEAATGMDRKLFPAPPRDWKNTIDRQLFAELNDVLVRACHPDPESRYQTAREMQSELLALENGKSLRIYRLQEQALQKFKTYARISVAFIVLLSAFVLVFYQRAENERKIRESYTEYQFASIAQYLKDGNFVNAYRTMVDTVSGRSEALQAGVANSGFSQFESALVRSWVSDFPVLESFTLFGTTRRKGAGTEAVSEVTLDGSGEPLSLNNCHFLSGGSQALVVGDHGFAAILDPAGGSDSRTETPGSDGVKILQPVRIGEKLTVRVASASPDGSLILVGSGDPWGVNVYDTQTFELHGVIEPTEDTPRPGWENGSVPNAIAYSPDGRLVAIGYEEMHIAIYDLQTMKQVCPMLKLDYNIYTIQALSWSPSGRSLIGGGYFIAPPGRQLPNANLFICEIIHDDKGVRFGEVDYTSTGRWTDLWDIKSHPGKPVFYLAGGDGMVRVTQFDEPQFLKSGKGETALMESALIGNKGKEIRRMHYSSDLSLVMSASWGNILRIEGGPVIPSFFPEIPHSGKLNGLDLSPDSTRVLTVCHNGACYVWNLAGRHYGSEYQVDRFYKDCGIGLAIHEEEQTLRLHDFRADVEKEPCTIHFRQLALNPELSPPDRVQLSSDRKQVVLFQKEPGRESWRGFTYTLEDLLEGHGDLDPSPLPGAIRNTANFEYHSGLKVSLEMRTVSDHSGDSRPFLFITSDRAGSATWSVPLHPESLQWRFLPDGRHLSVIESAGQDQDLQLAIYNLESGKKVAHMSLDPSDGFVSSLTWASDSRKLLVTRSSLDFEKRGAGLYRISVKNESNWELTPVGYARHDDGILHGYIFQDGSRYATLGEDGEVRIWKNSKLLHRFKMDSEVSTFSITPDEKMMAAGTKQGNIYLWDLEKYMPLGSPFFTLPLSRFELSLVPDGSGLVAYSPSEGSLFARRTSSVDHGDDAMGMLQFYFSSFVGGDDRLSRKQWLNTYRDLRKNLPDYFGTTAAERQSYYKYLLSLVSGSHQSQILVREYLMQQLEGVSSVANAR